MFADFILPIILKYSAEPRDHLLLPGCFEPALADSLLPDLQMKWLIYSLASGQLINVITATKFR